MITISVHTFYFLFPIIAVYITSLKRGVLCLVLSIAAAAVINDFISLTFSGSYEADDLSNFLYFWFPNQFPVFMLGVCAYFVILSLGDRDSGVVNIMRNNGSLVSVALICMSYCQIWCLRIIGHAAIWLGFMVSIPSLNVTPVMTLAR